LRGRPRPRRFTEIAGKENAEVKKLRIFNKDTAGNCVIRILTLNDITTCTIVADAEKVINYRRRYNMISSSKSEKLAIVSFFSN
jgi:hypothetical protein